MRKADLLIHQHVRVSYMSDAKWYRLIDALTDHFEAGLHIRYKRIDGVKVRESVWYSPDFTPFFAEPVLFKEVEWVEFPGSYEAFVNPNHQKAGVHRCTQDLDAIETAIRRIGQFELERSDGSLRLYANHK